MAEYLEGGIFRGRKIYRAENFSVFLLMKVVNKSVTEEM